MEEILEKIPALPGIYQMLGRKDKIIYIGKAKNLKLRVRSYFRASGDDRWFIPRLRNEVRDIQCIVTNTENEALILENRLIKKEKPVYNVRLKDDKEYLLLKLDKNHLFPRIEVCRKKDQENPGIKYFGPYPSAANIRYTLRFLSRTFGLRTCSDHVLKTRKRACTLYHIGRCPAPCEFEIDSETYKKQVLRVESFLGGDLKSLIAELELQMKKEAALMRFEEAAKLRNAIRNIENTSSRQKAAKNENEHVDVFCHYGEGNNILIQMLSFRSRHLEDSNFFYFNEVIEDNSELLSRLIFNFYQDDPEPPDKIIVPRDFKEQHLLETALRECLKKTIKVKTIPSVDDARFQLMAFKNAQFNFRKKNKSVLAKISQGRLRMQSLLNLPKLPESIECYDISNLGPSAAVGSMVRLDGDSMEPANYRIFHIKDVEGQNDFAMMRETLLRRLRNTEDMPPLPSIFLIDGGLGQLNTVKDLKTTNSEEKLNFVSIAKARTKKKSKERLIREDGSIFEIEETDPIYFLLTKLRDEAHRFAVKHHRILRGKGSFKSDLSEIPGVGDKTIKKLFLAFKNRENIESASAELISSKAGIAKATAEKIEKFLKDRSS